MYNNNRKTGCFMSL